MLESSRGNLKMLDSNLNRGVQVYSLVCTLTSPHIYKPKYDSSPLSNEVHDGENDISQTRVGPAQELALQRDLASTRRIFDVPRREVDSESMQLRADLQSALRRVMELEKCMRDNRFLRRERIQLGLEVSVAGERRVSASGLPFMMVLALIVVIIPGAYKYYAFSA